MSRDPHATQQPDAAETLCEAEKHAPRGAARRGLVHVSEYLDDAVHELRHAAAQLKDRIDPPVSDPDMPQSGDRGRESRGGQHKWGWL